MPRWGKSAGRRIRPHVHRGQDDALPSTAEQSDAQAAPSAPGTAQAESARSRMAGQRVAADSVRDLPAVPPTETERRARLLLLSVKAPNPQIATAAVEAAATARCLLPFTRLSTDLNAAAAIARFLVWAAYPTVRGGPEARFPPLQRRPLSDVLRNRGGARVA
jgi:hypothetical protein